MPGSPRSTTEQAVRRTAHKVPEPIKVAVFIRDRGCRAALRIVGEVPPAVEAALVSLAKVGHCWGEHHPHHLWLQGQGGPDEPWNLIELCANHHRWVHAEVRHSRQLGLLCRSGERIYDDDGAPIPGHPLH